MRIRSLVVGCCTALLLTLLSVKAQAGTPGTCSNTNTDCTYNCPTDGSTCQITLQRSSGQVNMMMGNKAVTIFCAKPGTPIQWTVSDATSFVDVRFAPSSSPFAQSSIFADSNNNNTSTSISSSATGCYSFAIADCPFSSGATAGCGYADPKVVIYPSR